MEPLLIVLIPGLLGGVVLALFILSVRLPARQPARWHPLEPPSPGHINMARIRVDGVGGLGMVAMATTVALFEPRIRLAMIIAVVLGAFLGIVLIVLRRDGPLSSGSHDPGARSMLPLDGAQRAEPGGPSSGRTGAAELRHAVEVCF
jgi:hypothetical protein